MRENQILLVNFHNFDKKCYEMEEALGLQYIATYLESKEIHSEVCDTAIVTISLENIVDKIVNQDYLIVAFSIYQTTYDYTKQVIAELLKRHYRGHIILGGYFVSLAYKEVLSEIGDYIDCIIFGEGEQAFYNYAKRIIKNEPWKDLKSVIYKENNKIIVNDKLELIYDLDTIPIPKREKMQFRKLAKIYSSRGCYGRCAFCSIYCFFGFDKKKWRSRSVENIIEEIKYLLEEHGIKSLYFVDDNFMGLGKNGKERAYRLAESIIENNIKVTYSVEFRVNDADYTVISKMKESGLRKIFYGVESGVQKELDLLNKFTTTAQNIEAIKMTYLAGIEPNIGFIMFTPYTSFDEILENLEFLEGLIQYNCLSNSMIKSRLIIQPGFDIYERLKAENRIIWDNTTYQYVYEFVDKKVELYYSILVSNYNTDIGGLNADLAQIKDELFIWDLYDDKCYEYQCIRQLEREVFLIELDYAKEIARIVDENQPEQIDTLNYTISQKVDTALKLYNNLLKDGRFKKYMKKVPE
ncbi:B12-binding domain-containing radical SAM protein [Anaerocolumna xylanovorans]|uniref:Radical SAM superfamily enzyme YgiQ, UPF0313 family n=1 Tax=Anaerocolumna xylanovorans DSM 12503 TaxID=1121345 RepID=A0A1M7YEC1_9FIRM|nr:radical SAM protein [Anaerocolumna xylanovorans]SHO50963.1 Radical SAM superfamily enzyme YgiQ, UPF0313 family [Anaerocolumna xylanovorans DSM 12503]